jgi:hypothetical protein
MPTFSRMTRRGDFFAAALASAGHSHVNVQKII